VVRAKHSVDKVAATIPGMSTPVAPRIVPIVDLRTSAPASVGTANLPVWLGGNAPLIAPTGLLADQLGRPLRDLRISVTDRCNFRCSYCMPKEVFDKDYSYLPHASLLSFEEITRLARLFVAHGVRKIRLTGGEPLLRKNIEVLIEQLAQLRTLDGQPLDLTLTTNASLLARKARALKDAGLQRVTVSLDALDDAIFRRMNDVDFPVADVLKGIEAAQAVGLGVIDNYYSINSKLLRKDGGNRTVSLVDSAYAASGLKVNMVVKRGTNDSEILPMARHFKGSGIALRFIEYMDVGATNGWRMNEVVPSSEVVKLIHAQMPLVQLEPSAPGETAARWGYANVQGKHDRAAGEIGLISSVTQAFCHDCNRARLSTEGQVYLCLFGSQGHDLRGPMRAGESDAQLASRVAHMWSGRTDRYSELRSHQPADTGCGARRVEMSYIGG
jgi:GTP 3',8-cyclase